METTNSQTDGKREIAIVAAVDKYGGIGRDGRLLCHLPGDMEHFRKITLGHSIIMGRRTFESLPNGALDGRQNIVLTHNPDFAADDVTVAHSLDEAIAAATMPGEVMIIGGAQVFEQALPQVERIYLTRIMATFVHADVFFPKLVDKEWVTVDSKFNFSDYRNKHSYKFETLERRNVHNCLFALERLPW